MAREAREKREKPLKLVGEPLVMKARDAHLQLVREPALVLQLVVEAQWAWVLVMDPMFQL